MNAKQLILCVSALAGVICVGSCRDSEPTDSADTYTYRVVNKYNHDRQAFTQGLAYDGGFFYEGTGLNGRSSIRKVGINSGAILLSRKLSEEYFGEGITVYQDRIIQLTWQAQTGFVYDKESFRLIKQFSYQGEGWGITHDGKKLIMSDGTAKLRLLDPETFENTGNIEVFDHQGPVENLNELEYIKGRIYANVWESSRIAVIEPQTGKVTGWINLKNLYKPTGWDAEAKIPNGIAYDAENDRLFVTGKLWPNIFEIEILEEE